MRLRIKKDHDHWVGPASVRTFRADTEVSVPTDVAKALIQVGVAEEIKDRPTVEAKEKVT